MSTERNWQALIELCSSHYKKFKAWPTIEGNTIYFFKNFSLELITLSESEMQEFKTRLPQMFP